MKKTKISNLNFEFHQEKLHSLTQRYTKPKIKTSKQLYIANLQIKQQAFLHAIRADPQRLFHLLIFVF